jgi:hypothetical protein
MFELTIKNEFMGTRGKHQAMRGDEIIASMTGSTASASFKLAKRLYTVTLNTEQIIEFRQLGGFTIDHVFYEIYLDNEYLGRVKRRSVKVVYEIDMVGGKLFSIERGWLAIGTIKYTNLAGDEITIETGRTGVLNWKVSSENELLPLDIALILFVRAMSELMIQ